MLGSDKTSEDLGEDVDNIWDDMKEITTTERRSQSKHVKQTTITKRTHTSKQSELGGRTIKKTKK